MMTAARSLALLAVVVASAGACGETERAKAEGLRALEVARKQQLARRISIADAGSAQGAPLAVWILPPQLHEISGLTLTPDGQVFAHNDEAGRVLKIDPKTGIVVKQFKLEGDPTGDFEAIATVGADIYLLESNGKLYKFQEGADGDHVPFTKYDTRLGRECDFEGLAYDSDNSWLLLACKTAAKKSLRTDLAIYRLSLPIADSSTLSMLTIPKAEVIGSNRWKNFQPSDLAIDPTNGNYVLIASQQKAIAVITPEGEVVRSEPLPGNHQQAEGVAVTRDGILIVSDEARHRPAAITLYRWRP